MAARFARCHFARIRSQLDFWRYAAHSPAEHLRKRASRLRPQGTFLGAEGLTDEEADAIELSNEQYDDLRRRADEIDERHNAPHDALEIDVLRLGRRGGG